MKKHNASMAPIQNNMLSELDELKEVLRFKNRLLYIISHDVKGPVSSLITYLKLIEKDLVGSNEFMSVNNVMKLQLTTIYNLLSNMLDLADNGDLNEWRKKDTFDVSSLADTNIALLASHSEVKQLTLENSIPKGLHIHACKREIDVVFRNLLFNAVKFTPHGGTIQLLANSTQVSMQLIVKDNGIGIDPEEKARIFERKEPTTTIGTNGERGSGLGLNLCNEYIKRNGGTISVESEKDKGCSMILEFPLSIFGWDRRQVPV